MWRGLAALVAFWVMAGGQVAGEEPVKLKPPDKRLWAKASDLPPKGAGGTIAQDDATTTSRCIGNPVTPLCAVETLLACFTRGEASLCRKVLTKDPSPYMEEGRPDSLRRLYRVTRATVLTNRRLPWSPLTDMGQPPDVPSVWAGDVRLDVRYKLCFPGQCTQVFESTSYVVRKSASDTWMVIGWWSWGSGRMPSTRRD